MPMVLPGAGSFLGDRAAVQESGKLTQVPQIVLNGAGAALLPPQMALELLYVLYCDGLFLHGILLSENRISCFIVLHGRNLVQYENTADSAGPII